VSLVWAAVLGLVQGVAEFLPISSTAHLKLVPWVFGFQGLYPILSSPQFDIALHAGSALAILIALWADWRHLLDGAVRRERAALAFIGFLLITSVPGALFGVLLEKKIEVFSSPADFHWAPLVVGLALIAFGVLLWAVDRYTERKQPLEKMNWLRALLIGLAQALALIPGVGGARAPARR
jgi:undecaprenyl-diphosphatase